METGRMTHQLGKGRGRRLVEKHLNLILNWELFKKRVGKMEKSLKAYGTLNMSRSTGKEDNWKM